MLEEQPRADSFLALALREWRSGSPGSTGPARGQLGARVGKATRDPREPPESEPPHPPRGEEAHEGSAPPASSCPQGPGREWGTLVTATSAAF